jgi:hypothetical protein
MRHQKHSVSLGVTYRMVAYKAVKIIGMHIFDSNTLAAVTSSKIARERLTSNGVSASYYNSPHNEPL